MDNVIVATISVLEIVRSECESILSCKNTKTGKG